MKGSELVHKLKSLLLKIKRLSGSDFSGIGVLVSDQPEYLPIVPLRKAQHAVAYNDTASYLAEISKNSSPYHDGFHILSSDLKVLLISQYFSPPIISDVRIDRTKLFGGRYLAALYGSKVPSVKISGISSCGFGTAIFVAGEEALYEGDAC